MVDSNPMSSAGHIKLLCSAQNIKKWTVWFYTTHCKPQKQQLVSKEYNNGTHKCEGKVGHPIVEERSCSPITICLEGFHHQFRFFSLGGLLIGFVLGQLSPWLKCCCWLMPFLPPLWAVWYFWHCLEGLQLDKLVMNEWASFLFWLFLADFWKIVNLWWYEAFKANFGVLGHRIFHALLHPQNNGVKIEILLNFWGFRVLGRSIFLIN
jgi:hypothetical protein